jgi:hypothetical protein
MVKPVVAALAALLCIPAWDVASAQVTPPAAPAYACTGSEHRAFDFWVGSWEAYVTGTNTIAGTNRVERRDGGCVIAERWSSQGAPYSGSSLSMYDPTASRWIQVWMDSGGEVTRFEGGPTPTGMMLTAPDETKPGRPGRATLRMTFTRNPDGSVRQLGETSPDRGVSWSTSYDFTYRLKPG